MNKQVKVGLLVVLALLGGLGLASLFAPEKTKEVIREVIREPLGALPGPDISSEFWSAGALKRYSQEIPINTGTSSVLCAFENNFSGTSTIAHVGVDITRGVTGANTIYISTTTALFPYGSSTPNLIADFRIPSGKTARIAWNPNTATTTNAAGNPASAPPDVLAGISISGASNYLIGPGEWLTVRVATGTPGTFATGFAGTCGAEFIDL